MRFDPSGDLVVEGTECSNQPVQVTPSAYDYLGSSCTRIEFWGKLSPSATAVTASTQLPSLLEGNRLNVDSSGNSYVVGQGVDGNLLLQRISPGGTPAWSGELAGGFGASGLAILGDGTTVVAGPTEVANLQTLNTLFPCPQNLPDVNTTHFQGFSGFVAAFDSSGNLTFSTYLGASPDGYPSSLAVAPDGSLYVAGDGATDLPGNNLLVPSAAGRVFGLKLDLNAVPRGIPAPSCIVHGASLRASAVSPGMIVAMYGSNLGPADGVSYTFDQNSLVPTQLAGVGVNVNGIPAPILYAQANQINFVVPREISGTTSNICVSAQGGQNCLPSLLVDAFPGVFILPTGPAVFNPDWTQNSQANPVTAGSYVTVLGTGFGPYNFALPDGSVVPSNFFIWETLPTYGALSLNQSCAFPGYNVPCPVYSTNFEFAGAAPTLINGVDQANVNIPKSLAKGWYQLTDHDGYVADLAYFGLGQVIRRPERSTNPPRQFGH